MDGDRVEFEQLVRQARAGDVGAFERLYRSLESGVHSYLLSQVREAELAVDLTQETFVRAWESLGRLRSPGAFRGWLYRIATNLVRDHVKSGRAKLEVTEAALAGEEGQASEAAASGDGPEGAAMAAELRSAVWSAIEQLAPPQRAAVVMHHLEGMSVQEIARAQGVRPGTVLSRLARGREALRRLLGPYVEGQDEAEGM